MSPVPGQEGPPGSFEERAAQWFLELAFFRDLVVRNPPSKGGKGELADAVVLCSDSAILVQVKTQDSDRPPLEWARKELPLALKQLRHTRRMLVDGHVLRLKSETVGEMTFDTKRHTAIYGVIVLAQPAEPYSAEDAAPELSEETFPVHVLSLADFCRVAELFDTAGDFIHYLDVRLALRGALKYLVHDEAASLEGISARAEELFKVWRPDMPSEILERSIRAFRARTSGELRRSPDFGYGQLFDDIISRLHDQDPDLRYRIETGSSGVLRIIEQLSLYTRDRRIALGKRMASSCRNASGGSDSYWCTFRRPLGTVFTFLASGEAREKRIEYLEALARVAQAKYDAERVIGVATEPIGGGRSYDVLYAEGTLEDSLRQQLLEHGDPFGDDAGQLVP